LNSFDSLLNILPLFQKGTVDFYLKNKMPATKIMMGFPTYGRTYKLANPNQFGLHAPAVGHGDPGPIRKLRGIYTYQDVSMIYI
jgi:chitinase